MWKRVWGVGTAQAKTLGLPSAGQILLVVQRHSLAMASRDQAGQPTRACMRTLCFLRSMDLILAVQGETESLICASEISLWRDAHATVFLLDHESECLLECHAAGRYLHCPCLGHSANRGRAMSKRRLLDPPRGFAGLWHRGWKVSLVDSSIPGWPGCEVSWSRTLPRPSQRFPILGEM